MSGTRRGSPGGWQEPRVPQIAVPYYNSMRSPVLTFALFPYLELFVLPSGSLGYITEIELRPLPIWVTYQRLRDSLHRLSSKERIGLLRTVVEHQPYVDIRLFQFERFIALPYLVLFPPAFRATRCRGKILRLYLFVFGTAEAISPFFCTQILVYIYIHKLLFDKIDFTLYLSEYMCIESRGCMEKLCPQTLWTAWVMLQNLDHSVNKVKLYKGSGDSVPGGKGSNR